MTSTESGIDRDDLVGHDEHDEHAHPTDRRYVNIAITLAVLTAIEVGLFVLEDSLGSAIVKVGLLSLMAVKFWMVGAFFMHLKFDDSLLARLFIFGLALAVVVYVAMLSAFEFWSSGIEDPGLPG
jgi:caa(3)-type oxidase subunit IV